MCVCEWRKWDVRGAGLDYSDARPSYFNLFTEPRTPRRMFENIGLESSWGCMQSGSGSRSGRNRGAAAEADAIGSSSWSGRKRQACSSSWSGRNRGAAAGSGRKRGAAVEADAVGPGSSSRFEADASGEQQLIRSGRKRRAAAEADAIGELQLCTESCQAPDYSR